MRVIPRKFRSLWREWDLRIFVLFSLTLQIILVILGSRRKYIRGAWIRITVWSAYLVADSIAIFGIGTLSNDLAEIYDDNGSINAKVELTAFWAPFLLLHLGGPDTITAYALEDNNLWLRHFLGLAIQTGGTVYILLMIWTGSLLSFLSIMMILAGFIKYGERVWVLRQASYEQRRDSPPDPGLNYSKLMEEYHLKLAEGYHVMADEVIEVKGSVDLSLYGIEASHDEDIILIPKAYGLLQRFKGLFVDLLLRDVDRDNSQFIVNDMSVTEAFKFVEIELGFMYDLLYTKAAIVYSPWGCTCRIISVSLTFSALVVFSLAENHKYLKVDVAITFLLLSVAVLLELYAILLQLSSDRAIVWLLKHKRFSIISLAITSLQRLNKTRWSDSMAQFSLLSFSANQNPTVYSRILKLIDQKLEKQLLVTSEKISPKLKESIFNHLKKKQYAESSGNSDLKLLWTDRVGKVLETFNCLEQLRWSTNVEFDQSILIWHIATEFYYYKDLGIIQDDAEAEAKAKINREMSKHMSEYMLYLLVMYPFMLPTGIGQIRFRDTSTEVMISFAKQKPKSGKLRACISQFKDLFITGNQMPDISGTCNKLVEEKLQLPAFIAEGERSKSVLFDACKLASQLQNISDMKEKWKMVRNVWLEMLTYAASQCSGNNHAQQLRRGGELLTHVWLLMAHLGISEQFQMSEGHVIAKLFVR